MITNHKLPPVDPQDFTTIVDNHMGFVLCNKDQSILITMTWNDRGPIHTVWFKNGGGMVHVKESDIQFKK